MIISDLRMPKRSFCDRHVIKMTLPYLTTQGNRVPFIHKGSRLSPESYALSHQPHICQRSQQMQNILKIFETYVNSRELLAELRTIVNWQNLMTLEVGCEHIGIFFHVQIFLRVVNFGLHVTSTCRQKSLIVQNVKFEVVWEASDEKRSTLTCTSSLHQASS